MGIKAVVIAFDKWVVWNSPELVIWLSGLLIVIYQGRGSSPSLAGASRWGLRGCLRPAITLRSKVWEDCGRC